MDKQMRIGRTTRVSTLNTFFTGNWFKTMTIRTIGWPYYILTKCGLYYEAHQILFFPVTTVVYLINIRQLNKLFSSQKRFLAVPFMSTTGVFFETNKKFS